MALKVFSPWPVAAAIGLFACLHATGLGSGLRDDHAFMAQVAPDNEANLAPPVASPQASKAVKFGKASDGLFYITAMVNGTPVRFLVDTGANLVVLTTNDAHRVGLAAKSMHSSGSIDTAGGSAAMERIKLQSINVAGQEASGIDAAVMHNGLKVSLLGQNMLSKLGDVTISGDKIVLHPRNSTSQAD